MFKFEKFDTFVVSQACKYINHDSFSSPILLPVRFQTFTFDIDVDIAPKQTPELSKPPVPSALFDDIIPYSLLSSVTAFILLLVFRN